MTTAHTPADWIDISIPLRPGMPHWPGDSAFAIARDKDMAAGDPYNLSRVAMSVHTGTHMDAPLHFLREGNSMDALPIDAVVGPARIIEIEHAVAIQAGELDRHGIQAGERILFKTLNSSRAWNHDEFYKDFVYIAKEAADYLAQRKIRTVGVDYLSVGGFYKDTAETHYSLLGAGIWVIEGLNLSTVAAGTYDLICLPLRLAGAEGSPARAVVRTRRDDT